MHKFLLVASNQVRRIPNINTNLKTKPTLTSGFKSLQGKIVSCQIWTPFDITCKTNYQLPRHKFILRVSTYDSITTRHVKTQVIVSDWAAVSLARCLGWTAWNVMIQREINSMTPSKSSMTGGVKLPSPKIPCSSWLSWSKETELTMSRISSSKNIFHHQFSHW